MKYRSKIQLTVYAKDEADFDQTLSDLEDSYIADTLKLERLGYTLEVSHDGGETWTRAEEN